MDHRRVRHDDHFPAAPPPDDSKLAAAVAAAGGGAMQVRVAGFLTASQRAARAYLAALLQMHLAAMVGEDLKAAGLEIAHDQFGTAAALAEQVRRVARMAVGGGLIQPDDPLLADLPK